KPLDGKDAMRTFGNWQNSGIETASPCQPWQGRSSITSDAFSQRQKKPIRSGWRCPKSEIVACRTPRERQGFSTSLAHRTQNDMQRVDWMSHLRSHNEVEVSPKCSGSRPTKSRIEIPTSAPDDAYTRGRDTKGVLK